MADTFFCLDRSKEDCKIFGEVAEGKGKTAAKLKKNRKCAEKQDKESTDNFKNYDSRKFLMFLYQGWYLHK